MGAQLKGGCQLLNENIRAIRKVKGLSQEELALRLHVVRQTVSKWEQGLSVPDADLLIALSEALETPVSTLLGETVAEGRPDDLRAISENLERINAQLARRKIAWRRALHGLCIAAAVLIAVVFAALVWLKSPYLNWHDSDPERVVFGAILHAFEYLFVRCAPIALIGSIAGACLTRRRA